MSLNPDDVTVREDAILPLMYAEEGRWRFVRVCYGDPVTPHAQQLEKMTLVSWRTYASALSLSFSSCCMRLYGQGVAGWWVRNWGENVRAEEDFIQMQ